MPKETEGSSSNAARSTPRTHSRRHSPLVVAQLIQVEVHAGLSGHHPNEQVGHTGEHTDKGREVFSGVVLAAGDYGWVDAADPFPQALPLVVAQFIQVEVQAGLGDHHCDEQVGHTGEHAEEGRGVGGIVAGGVRRDHGGRVDAADPFPQALPAVVAQLIQVQSHSIRGGPRSHPGDQRRQEDVSGRLRGEA